jgi:hypothetical protein
MAPAGCPNGPTENIVFFTGTELFVDGGGAQV